MNTWRAVLEARFPLRLDEKRLSIRAAAATAALLTSGAYEGARLVECRACDGSSRAEALWLIVDVPIGQFEPVNDIRGTEAVAVVFGDCLPPTAHPLREDFPERVPHLNISPPGYPRSLCLYEMPVDEILRIATPHAFIERIRWWLAETAHGTLHGDDQPLDPLLCHIGETVLLPNEDIAALAAEDLAFVQEIEGPAAPLLLVQTRDLQGSHDTPKETDRHATMVVLTKPIPHVGMVMPPATLEDLVVIYADLGIDLAALLRAAFRRWSSRGDLAEFLKRPWLLLLVTPMERSPGEFGAFMTRGFQTESASAASAAKALGAFLFEAGYISPPIGEIPFEDRAGHDIALKTHLLKRL